MATASVVLDPVFVDAWARRFLDAWNDLDGVAVASLCSEDVVWRDPSMPAPAVGRDAVREFVAITGTAFPDLRIAETTPPQLSSGSGRVLAPYRMTGTMLGPMDAFAPTRRAISIDGVDEWTFRGEFLAEYRTYYDTVDATRQLGIMPAAGSRSERLMARCQHVQAWFQRRRAPRIRG